jgi:ribosomal protein S3AE
MEKIIIKRASRYVFSKFVRYLISGKLATEIYKKAKKVHPVQTVDVWKSRVLNLPTISEEELAKEDEAKKAAKEAKEEKKEETKKEPKTEAKEEAVAAKSS